MPRGRRRLCLYPTVASHSTSFCADRNCARAQEGSRDPRPTVKGFRSSLGFLSASLYHIFVPYKSYRVFTLHWGWL